MDNLPGAGVKMKTTKCTTSAENAIGQCTKKEFRTMLEKRARTVNANGDALCPVYFCWSLANCPILLP